MTRENKKNVSIKIAPKDKAKLDSLADEAGLNRSEMMRKLIRARRLQRPKAAARKTVLGQNL